MKCPNWCFSYVVNAENFPQGEAEHAHSTAGQQGAPAQSPEGQGGSGLWGRRCCHDTLDRKRKWLSSSEEQKMLPITTELTCFPAERSKVKRAKENQMVIKARSHLTEPLWISLFSQSQRRPEARHHPCRRHRGQEGCTCTQEVRGDGRSPPEVRRVKDRLEVASRRGSHQERLQPHQQGRETLLNALTSPSFLPHVSLSRQDNKDAITNNVVRRGNNGFKIHFYVTSKIAFPRLEEIHFHTFKTKHILNVACYKKPRFLLCKNQGHGKKNKHPIISE